MTGVQTCALPISIKQPYLDAGKKVDEVAKTLSEAIEKGVKHIKKEITNRTTIVGLESREGETIEAKVRRIMSNNEPISDQAPLIYTERKDGINPDYDIRSDRFDFALDAMSKIEKSKRAERENRHKLTVEIVEDKPIQAPEAS